MWTKIGKRAISYDAAGEGGAGAGGGDGGDGGDVSQAFDWGEIPDEVRAFVDGKSPLEALTAALEERDAHKTGATRRKEQIAEELGADDEFAKTFAEKRGLFAAPKDEAGLIALAKSRITDDTKYEHPEIKDADGEMLDAFSQAARANGVGPAQYKAMIGGAVEALQAKATEAAAAMDESLKTEWGDDYAENNVKIEDFLRSVGDEKAGDIMGVLARFPPAQQRKAADVLVDLGKAVGTSERSGDGSGAGGVGGGSGDAEADWNAAKEAMAEAGSYDKMTEAQKEEYNRAFNARKAAQGAA